MNKFKFTFLIVFLFKTFYSQLPSLDFVKNLGALNNNRVTGKAIRVDRSGNIYSVGYFIGVSDFDPSPSNTFTLNATNGNVYISKLNPSGNFLWIKQFQTNENSYYGFDLDLALDTIGNVYIAGVFNGTVDLDPGPTTYTASSNKGSYVSMLNSNGNYLWSKVFSDSTGYCIVKSISIDRSNNILLTGSFNGKIDFDPSISTYTLNAGSGYNPFITKLDHLGNFEWAKQFTGTTNQAFQGTSITTDYSKNVYVTGNFKCLGDFDPSPLTYTLDASDNNREFIVKLDSLGNLNWAKCFGDGYFIGGGEIYSLPSSLRVDVSGNVIMGGNFYGTVDFDSGPFINSLGCNGCYGMFLTKYSSTGNFLWAKDILGDSYDTEFNSMDLDNNSNIYVTGALKGTFDFDPSPSTNTLSSVGQQDIFICKFNSTGTNLWAIQMGDTSFDAGNGICVFNNHYIYSTGKYKYNVDFDPGSGTVNLPTQSQNSYIHVMCQGCATSLSESDILNDIKLFPNPAKNYFEIKLKKVNQTKLTITDVLGNELMKVNLYEITQRIDISGLKSGCYYLLVNSEIGTSRVEKLIIE